MFKKEDIKPGMVVRTRNGELGVIQGSVSSICIVFETVYKEGKAGLYGENLQQYDENLKHVRYSDYDICEIWGGTTCYSEMVNPVIGSRKLIWKREPDVKEVTMAEIEKKFGCKIKIVEG